MIALDYLNNEFVVSSCTLEGAIFLFTTLMEKKIIHFTKKKRCLRQGSHVFLNMVAGKRPLSLKNGP